MPATEPKDLVEVPMPQLGESVSEGTLLEWHFKVGDTVEAGQTLAEISTDKVETELASPVSGTLVEILADVDETVEVGVPIAKISTRDGGTSTPAARGGGAGEEREEHAVSVEPASGAGADGALEDSAGEVRGAIGPRGHGRRYSPLVRRMAADHGLDLDQIEGSGRASRVTKRDILDHLEKGESSKAGTSVPPSSSERPIDSAEQAPLSTFRRTIAERMRASRATAAHCHSWIEVDMSRIESRRADTRLSPLPYVARAAIRALQAHPAINAWLEGETRTLHPHINLGIAVSLGIEGLIVPVIRHAENLSVEGLNERVKDLASRARSKKLEPGEVQGATFTITNQGVFGTYMSAPIINLPQVGILDLQAISKRVVVVEDEGGEDTIRIRPMTVLGLSWDHRALDGAQAGAFLAEIRDELESWPSDEPT